jgi:hypothetical protein
MSGAEGAYGEYYSRQLEAGRQYEDFVRETMMAKAGLCFLPYASKHSQFTKGENTGGIEVKYNGRFEETRNLWIEVAEKARPRDGPYARSGVFRGDNSWAWATGSYKTIFVFAINILRQLAHDASESGQLAENRFGTSLGFLMPETAAERHALLVLREAANGQWDAMQRLEAARIEQLYRRWRDSRSGQRKLWGDFPEGGSGE